MLGGVLRTDSTGRRHDTRMQNRIDAMRPQLEAWEALCRELGDEPAAVALAWVRQQDGVTAPIIGPRTLEQLDGAPLRSLDLVLEQAVLDRLDQIFPGPGGPAPEAYAW
jgi:aryl-alcohol dehydrogenase-like predicted oxidoreductase